MSTYISPGTGIPVNSAAVLDSSRDTSTASIVPNVAYFQHGASGGSPVNANSSVELIPHRIFVGGFPSATVEHELRTFFEAYGRIREVKIIRSPDGSSKGYGFITFDTEEEAQTVRKQGPAAYAVVVPGQHAYTSLAPYPSNFTYTSGQQLAHHQPRFIVPLANNQVLSGHSVAGAQQSPEKTCVSSTTTPSRPSQSSASGNVGIQQQQSSPQSSPQHTNTPTRNTSQTNYGNANALYNQTGYGYNQPLTPITPGMTQQSGFRWPGGVQMQGQVYPQTAVYPGSSGYYQVSDMTHYSQMYPCGQVQQQSDYYPYQDLYPTPVDASKIGPSYVANDMGGNLYRAVAAMSGPCRATIHSSDEDSSETIGARSPRSNRDLGGSGRIRKGKKSGKAFPADPVTPEKKMGLAALRSPNASPDSMGSGDGGWRPRNLKARNSMSLPNSPGVFSSLPFKHGKANYLGNNSKPQSPYQRASVGGGGSGGRSPRKSVVSLTNQMNQLSVNGNGTNDMGV